MNPGDIVRVIENPSRTGIVTPSGRRFFGEVERVQISFTDGVIGWLSLMAVELVPQHHSPEDEMKRAQCVGAEATRRILLHEKLSGRLAGVLYSMETSDTRFLPYQFKPVLKLIESPCNGLLIADEVGLGKTIEAGLIWTELRARAGAQRLLVVCPPKLKLKWLRELSRRFGVKAEEAGAKELLEHLQEYRRNNSHGFALVCSYNSIRPPKGWEEMESAGDHRRELAALFHEVSEAGPLLDLLVMDEAHYMRNSETQTFELGELTTDVAAHRVFLSATPIHTSNKNLHSLLRLLDPDTFSSERAFEDILSANVPLVRLRDAIISPSSTLPELRGLIDDARANAYLFDSEKLSSLRKALAAPDALATPSRRVELAYEAETCNQLGHVISRTRKRQVFSQEDRVVREVMAHKVPLHKGERAVYEAVCDIAVEFAVTHNLPEQFLAVTPQRLVSSSIVGALRHWTVLNGRNRLTDDPEDQSNSGPFVDLLRKRLGGRFDLNRLAAKDAKYDRLLSELRAYRAEHPGKKILLFTTFHPTIHYLEERLLRDGIRCLVLKGGSMHLPQEIVDDFAKTDGPDLLLSTEVGGEGLDIQFASTLINYDLPWNPMVVEQRIGRIDRIGQEAKKILILNFLHEATIDERIYDRLYQRLDLFRDSIGDLEAVVGPILGKMQRALLGHKCSPEEEAKIIADADIAIESERQAKERLEESAAIFAAYGDYLLNQIQARHEREQWVTGADLEHYVLAYFREFAPDCRIKGEDHATRTFTLQLDFDTFHRFDQFLQLTNLVGHTRICSSSPTRVRFDHRVFGKAAPGTETVSQAHPLVRFVSAEIREKQLAKTVPIAVAANHDPQRLACPLGLYFINVQRWEVTGLKPSTRLRFDARLDNTATSLDEAVAEGLIEFAAKYGTRWADWDSYVDPEEAVSLTQELEDIGIDAFNTYEANCEAENRDRARVQMTALNRFESRRAAQLLGTIQRHIESGRANLKAADTARLAKLRERCALDRLKIEQKARVYAEPSRLFFGMINLV